MIRGRLVAVNGKPVSGKDFENRDDDGQAQRRAEREFNLSFSPTLRADNEVTDGTFWPADYRGEPQLSVEEGYAKTLDWKVGDRIAFDIAGQAYEAKLTSLRKVDWESFQPNFFVIGSPGSLDGFPASYIGGVHVDRNDTSFTNGLVTAFPNLSVIDIDAVMDQVRSTVDQVSLVVEAVFYFS